MRQLGSSPLRHLVIAVALALAPATATACQPSRAGRPCGTRTFARDASGWLLTCPRGRWVRRIKLDDLRNVLGHRDRPLAVPAGWIVDTLTRDATDDFAFEPTAAGDQLTIAASPTNTDTNSRLLIRRSGSPEDVDQLACATFGRHPSSSAGDAEHRFQQGIALRVTGTGSDLRAITVSKNVWSGAVWMFNVHLWDLARQPAMELVAQFDLGPGLREGGTIAALPWRVCAQVVGNELSFSAWPTSTIEPGSWDQPGLGGHVTLPPGWTHRGGAGWYVGHVPAGDALIMSDLEVGAPAPSPAKPRSTPPTTTLSPTTTTTSGPATTGQGLSPAPHPTAGGSG